MAFVLAFGMPIHSSPDPPHTHSPEGPTYKSHGMRECCEFSLEGSGKVCVVCV